MGCIHFVYGTICTIIHKHYDFFKFKWNDWTSTEFSFKKQSVGGVVNDLS